MKGLSDTEVRPKQGSKASPGAKAGPKQGRSLPTAMKLLFMTLGLLVVVVALVACGAGLLFSGRIERDMSAEQICAADSPVLATQRTLKEDYPSIGMNRAYVMIEADISDPEVLAAADKSIANMADDVHVAKISNEAKVRSIVPYVKEVVKPDKEEFPRGRRSRIKVLDENKDRMPDSREGMVAVLDELYANGIDEVATAEKVMSLLSRKEGNRVYDMTLLVIETNQTQGSGGEKLLAELAEDFRPLTNRPGVNIRYAGYVFERAVILTEMTNGMIRGTFVAILLCALVVVLLFGSLRFGLIAALPVILITGWILGVMYVFGFTLNVITATITAMGVGIGIDYSIHLVQRYRQEKQAGRSISQAITQAIRRTGYSLIGAGLTTFFGFFVMTFSQIRMIRSFGILASLLIVFSLASALIVLPVLLFLSEKVAERIRGRDG